MFSPRQLCQLFIPAGFALVGLLFYLLTKQYVLGFKYDPLIHESLLVTEVLNSQASVGLRPDDEVVAIVSPNKELSVASRLFPISLRERRERFDSVENYYLQLDTIQTQLSQATYLRLANGKLVPYEPITLALDEIPLSVMSSVFSGLLAWLLTMLVWVWYPTKLSAICLMVNGFGFFLMAISSAMLAEGLAIFSVSFSSLLHHLFFAGHILFLVFGLCVLVYFPVTLTKANLIRNGILIIGFCLIIGTIWRNWQPRLHWQDQQIFVSSYELYSFIGGCFVIAISLCFLQWQATQKNSIKRLHLYWVFAAWMVAPASYIVLYMLPMAFDFKPIMTRPMTWMVMCVCYVSILIVIRRFGLLYLNQHLKRATKWVLTIVLFLMLDLLILLLVSIDQTISLLGWLILVIWGYFPIRYALMQYQERHHHERENYEFRHAISCLFRQSDTSVFSEPKTNLIWADLLSVAFKPMSIFESVDSAKSRLLEQGQCLYVEANKYSPAVTIRHAQGGSRLFNDNDLEMANTLYFLYEQALQFKTAFIKGQDQERQRIRRDLHDQIAFQLVSLIYSSDLESSRTIAKNTLAELRLLIKALRPNLTNLKSLHDDLKALVEPFCRLANLELSWHKNYDLPDIKISGRQYVNLMSVVRELLVNIQRHSSADQVSITISLADKQLTIFVHDNGVGSDEFESVNGNGVNNLRNRVEEIHGTITWSKNAGTLVSIYVPFQTEIIGKQDEGTNC